MLSHVRLFATPWAAACQASLSIANTPSLLKLMSIVSVMPSNHLMFCRPLLLLPSIFPNIRVFSHQLRATVRPAHYWLQSWSSFVFFKHKKHTISAARPLHRPLPLPGWLPAALLNASFPFNREGCTPFCPSSLLTEPRSSSSPVYSSSTRSQASWRLAPLPALVAGSLISY